MVAGIAAKMEPDFWANSLKADVDSLNRLKEGGMEVVPVSDAMMTDIRTRTAPLLEALPQARAGGGQAGAGLSRRNQALGAGPW